MAKNGRIMVKNDQRGNKEVGKEVDHNNRRENM